MSERRETATEPKRFTGPQRPGVASVVYEPRSSHSTDNPLPRPPARKAATQTKKQADRVVTPPKGTFASESGRLGQDRATQFHTQLDKKQDF